MIMPGIMQERERHHEHPGKILHVLAEGPENEGRARHDSAHRRQHD